MKSGVLAEPIMIGREREIEELQQSFDLAAQGRGATVFVSGEAGSGKTRLVNEFIDKAIIDPQMHPPEESRAIISLFGGEIAITEKETAKGPERTCESENSSTKNTSKTN